MTDIPGTEKLTALKKDTEQYQPTVLSSVNVKELKRKKTDPTYTTNNPSPFDDLKNWLGVGFAIALIFLLLSIRYKRFLVIVPLGPIATFTSYHVRRFVRRFETKPKKYS